MRLSARCGYPVDYFHDMSVNSNEDLEIERNDVRDLLRALVGPLPANANDLTTEGSLQNLVPLKLLVRLLIECDKSLSAAVDNRAPFDEVMIHAFSSLGTWIARSAISINAAHIHIYTHV